MCFPVRSHRLTKNDIFYKIIADFPVTVNHEFLICRTLMKSFFFVFIILMKLSHFVINYLSKFNSSSIQVHLEFISIIIILRITIHINHQMKINLILSVFLCFCFYLSTIFIVSFSFSLELFDFCKN